MCCEPSPLAGIMQIVQSNARELLWNIGEDCCTIASLPIGSTLTTLFWGYYVSGLATCSVGRPHPLPPWSLPRVFYLKRIFYFCHGTHSRSLGLRAVPFAQHVSSRACHNANCLPFYYR